MFIFAGRWNLSRLFWQCLRFDIGGDIGGCRIPLVCQRSETPSNRAMSGHPLRCSRAGDVVQSQKFEEVVQKRESHIRPRPGRRRTIISRSRFPLFTLVFLLLVTLCTPAVASNRFRIHDKGSVQLADNLAEGQVIEVSPEILFDPRPAPASLLRKRQEEDVLYGRSSSENSTETGKRKEASRTASAASTTSSESTDTGIDSAPTGTNSPLPTAFDGGLGTNYTQETCPVFLRGMVSAQNFTSCLPFSVLLQVCISSGEKRSQKPQKLTTLFFCSELPILFPSLTVPRKHHAGAASKLLCQSSHMLKCHVDLRGDPPVPDRLPKRLEPATAIRTASVQRAPGVRHALQRLVPESPAEPIQQPELELLLRRRHHQHIRPDHQLRLLPAPGPAPSRGHPTHLRPMPARHHEHLLRRRRQPLPAHQPHVRQRRPARRHQLRPELHQRQCPGTFGRHERRRRVAQRRLKSVGSRRSRSRMEEFRRRRRAIPLVESAYLNRHIPILFFDCLLCIYLRYPFYSSSLS